MTASAYVRRWFRKFQGKRHRLFRARVRRAATRMDKIAQRRDWSVVKVKVRIDGSVYGYGDNPKVDVVNFGKAPRH